MTPSYKTGVIHGRFQPLHLGHMEYLLAGKQRCEFLYVGISVPDPRYAASSSENPHRSLPSSNPFNYYERLLMVRDSLLEAAVPREEFEIVPFPIDYPEYLKYYVPENSRFFLTIYDDWGREKAKIFESHAMETEILWERGMEERLTTGSAVRELIAKNEKWRHLVPPCVYQFIQKYSLHTRLRTPSLP